VTSDLVTSTVAYVHPSRSSQIQLGGRSPEAISTIDLSTRFAVPRGKYPPEIHIIQFSFSHSFSTSLSLLDQFPFSFSLTSRQIAWRVGPRQRQVEQLRRARRRVQRGLPARLAFPCSFVVRSRHKAPPVACRCAGFRQRLAAISDEPSCGGSSEGCSRCRRPGEGSPSASPLVGGSGSARREARPYPYLQIPFWQRQHPCKRRWRWREWPGDKERRHTPREQRRGTASRATVETGSAAAW
jgi:hypothetical protein